MTESVQDVWNDLIREYSRMASEKNRRGMIVSPSQEDYKRLDFQKRFQNAIRNDHRTCHYCHGFDGNPISRQDYIEDWFTDFDSGEPMGILSSDDLDHINFCQWCGRKLDADG